jgi:RNA polymerase sigma factor (sigma-70 family)
MDARHTATAAHARAEYDQVFCALLPRLYRRTLALTNSPQTAEDALHDAYLKLANHPDRLVRHPEPYAYAFSAVVSTIRDGWRRRSREVLLDDVTVLPAEGPDRYDGWDGGVTIREAELETLRLLSNLTPRQAAIVLLVDVDGYTLDQVADLLGKHRGTVARSRDRALKKLRTVLQRAATTRHGGSR